MLCCVALSFYESQSLELSEETLYYFRGAIYNYADWSIREKTEICGQKLCNMCIGEIYACFKANRIYCTV